MALVRNPQTGLLEVVPNAPRAPVQLPKAEQPPPTNGGGLLSRLGKGALHFGADVIQAPFKALAAPAAALSEDLPALLQNRRPTSNAFSRWALGPGDPNSKERAGAYAMGALNAGMFGAPVLGSIQTTVAKTAAKAAAERLAAEKVAAIAAGRGGRFAVDRFGKQVVKNLPTDIGYGAGFGLASGVEQGQEGMDLAKSTLGGAALGVAAPIALGGAFKGAGALAGLTGRGFGQAVDSRIASLTGKLDDVRAARETAYPKYEPTVAMLQKEAKYKKQLDFAQKIKDLPTSMAQAWTNPNAHLKEVSKATGKDLVGLAEDNRAMGEGHAKALTQDYVAIRDTSADYAKTKRLAELLDMTDNLAGGKKIEGGKGINEITAEIRQIQKDAGIMWNRVQEDVKKVKAWHDRNLDLLVELGTVSPEEAARFRKAHPNYSTNTMRDFIENPAAYTKPSVSGGSSGIKAREGSTRVRIDSDEANIVAMEARIRNAFETKTRREVAQAADEAKVDTFGTLWSKQHELSLREGRKTLGEMSKQRKLAEKAKKSAWKALRRTSAEGREVSGRIGEVAAAKGKLKTMASQIKDKALTLEQSGMAKGATKLESAVPMQRKAYDPKNFFPEGKPNAKAGALFAKAVSVVKEADAIFKETATLSGEVMSIAGKPLAAAAAAAKRLSKLDAKLAEKDLAADARKAAIGEYRNVIEQLRQASAEVRDAMPKMSEAQVKGVDLAKDGLGTWKYMEDGIQVIRTAPKALADAMSGLSNPQARALGDFLDNNAFAKVFLKGPATVVRALATTLNLPFALWNNPTRDFQSAWVNAGFPLRDLGKATSMGIMSKIFPKSEVAAQFRALERDMMLSGAPTRGFYGRGHEDTAKMLLEQRKNLNPFARYVKNPLRIIEDAGSFMEETTRQAVYLRKLAETGDKVLAGRFARQATADFSRAGDWARVLNKMIPFLNASIQGTKSTVDAIAARPMDTARALVQSAMIPATYFYAHNAQYASYQDVPQWERDKYWIMMLGEGEGADVSGNPKKIPYYLKIPKGPSQQIVAAFAERALNKGREEYPESTLDFVKTIVGGLSPISSSNWIPTAMLYPVELITNYSFFRKKEIEPEWVLTKNGDWKKSSEVPPALRSAYDTSGLAKDIGAALGWSPAKIDYVIKTGALNDLIRTFSPAQAASSSARPDTTIEKISKAPFLRAVVGSSAYGQDIRRKAAETKALQEANAAEIANPFSAKAKAYRDGTASPLEALQFKELLRDPANRKKYKAWIEDERLGITPVEKSLLAKGVADGERAGIIFNNMNTMEPDEAKDYLAKLRRQRVATPDIMRQLRKLEEAE